MSSQPPRPRTRWLLLLALGLVGSGSAYGYWAFWLDHPVGTGPAGPNVPAQAFIHAWSERAVLLLGLGDSVTQGYGASPGRDYFGLLFDGHASDDATIAGCNLKVVLPQLTALNLSVSGSTSIECEDYQLRKIPPQAPEVFGVVVMTTGGNDVIHNYGQTPPREGAMYGATMQQAAGWIANFAARLERILVEIEAKFPGGCEIFLANIYDPTDGVGDTQNAGLPAWPDGLAVLKAYNKVIQSTADRRPQVTLVDMRAGFLGHGIHCRKFWRGTYRAEDPCYWYFENLEDPNDRGYDALRRMFLLAMVPVVPNRLIVPSARRRFELELALGGNRAHAQEPASDKDLQWLSAQPRALGFIELLLDHPRNQVTALGIAALAELKQLWHLRIRGGELDDAAARELANLASLRILNLPHTQFTDDGLTAVAKLSNLVQLRLGAAAVTKAGLAELARLPALKRVHLIDVPVDDEGLAVLASLPQLESLYLDGAQISDVAYEDLFRTHPRLHVHVNQSHHDRDPRKGDHVDATSGDH